MAAAPNSERHGLSPWWSLLLLPVAMLVGWLIGQMPGPPPKPVAATAPRAPAAMKEAPRPAPAPPASAVVVDIGRPEPPPLVTDDQKPPELSEWTTYDNALAESRRNGKPLLIDFNAEWCGPCRRLKAEVFDDADRGRAVRQAVIPVSIVDRTREYGSNPREIEDLQHTYEVRAFPTMVVFSPHSGRAVKIEGYGDADRAVEWITETAKSVR